MLRYKGALYIDVLADLIKLIHMLCCLPKMILGVWEPVSSHRWHQTTTQSLLTDGAAG